VFFGTVHVGGATEVMDVDKTGLLVSMLVDLAHAPPVEFPPPPEAAMVCVRVGGCACACACACVRVHVRMRVRVCGPCPHDARPLHGLLRDFLAGPLCCLGAHCDCATAH
jgi:hypothetical protein